MMGPGEDPLGGSDLQNLAEIQSDDDDPRYSARRRLLRNEYVSNVVPRLQVIVQIQDRRLHRHVEGRRRFVADDGALRTGCQSASICPPIGVGPFGRTGLSVAIDRAAGLSKDESP
jgi:hypothetical protein